MLVDSSRLLIDVVSLIGLHENRLAFFIVEVTHELVGIKVVLLDTERPRYFSPLVQFVLCKHALEIHVLNDSSCILVEQVAALTN